MDKQQYSHKLSNLSNHNSQFQNHSNQIKSITLLQFSLIKTLIIGPLISLTIIGVILLYQYKKFRSKVFYLETKNLQNATHIYILDNSNNDEIQRICYENNKQKQFMHKKLRYWIKETGIYEPVFYDFNQSDNNLTIQSIKTGLNTAQIIQKRNIYGLNEHSVDTPNYFKYMISVMFTPVYSVQYIVLLILILQGIPVMGFVLVTFSLLTTSGNYIALYFSNKKIKQIAQKSHIVKVIRQNSIAKIQSKQVVPGDILIIQNTQIYCDAVLIQGQAYMNQNSLTGQTVPVAKFSVKLQELNKIQDHNMLFQGTANIEVAQNTKAIVIKTGFMTRKGRILRQILNRTPQQPDFFNKAIIFLIFSGLLSVVIFFATLKMKLDADIDRSLIWLDIIHFIMNSTYPAFSIYFTMAYSLSIYRLRKHNILTTMPQKTIQSNRLKISCFDKTGTLTQNSLILDKIYLYDSKKGLIEYQLYDQLSEIYIVMMVLFGSCHTVRQHNNQLLGDEVDLRMYEFSKFKLINTKQGDIYEGINNKKYKLIKIHQFQSKYKSMCVLIHDIGQNRYYCLSKGAPQKMIQSSITKIPQFQQFISQLSLQGLRTIGFSYKQILQQQIDEYKQCNRQKYIEQSRLIGVVTFENELKKDTFQTIQTLQQANIQCKIITGDGIFIAIQTAYRAGIINLTNQILVIQGKKQLYANQKYQNKLNQNININNQTINQNNQNNKYGNNMNNEYENKNIIKGLILTQTQNHKYTKQYRQININQLNQLNNKFTNLVIAIDNDYFNINPHPSILLSTKIFARIDPQSKAKIIKSLKQTLIQQWQQQPLLNKIFGPGCSKISMTGDGANDLLAIRQANVGIGISNCDASYGAAFTIQSLKQIIHVFKQSKCTTQNIIQNFRYIIIISYLNIVVDIIGSTQATQLSQSSALFCNFFMITTLPIMQAYSKPDIKSKFTKQIVQDNFLSLQNYLLTWGNTIILSLGMICGCYYITNHDNYIPNPKPYWRLVQGYNAQCQLVTAMFLFIGIPLTTVILIVYKSNPFKQAIYRSKALMIMFIVDIGIMLYFYIGNSSSAVGVFEMVPLPQGSCIYLFMISIGFQVVAYMFNVILWKYFDGKDKVMVNSNRKEQVMQISEPTIDTNLLN